MDRFRVRIIKYIVIVIVTMDVVESNTKICRTCGIKKQKTEFNKDACKKDGYYTMCKSCKRNYRISPEYKLREKELEKTFSYKERQRRFYSTLKGKSYSSLECHRDNSFLPRSSHTLKHLEWISILELQQHACAICGSKDKSLERDCIIPLSKGGALTFSNTQALCKSCNSRKGAKLLSVITPISNHGYQT